MEALQNHLNTLDPATLTYAHLRPWIAGLDVDALGYEPFVPPLQAGAAYTRHIVTLAPVECVLLHWSPGGASAIHEHAGFWGHVLVLDGIMENVTYTLENKRLIPHPVLRYAVGEIVPEPEGIIHHIANADSAHPLITLHFYYPALETLDGLALYDLATGRKGILNEKAQSASWAEPPAHFHTITEDAFIVA